MITEWMDGEMMDGWIAFYSLFTVYSSNQGKVVVSTRDPDSIQSKVAVGAKDPEQTWSKVVVRIRDPE